MLEVAGFELLPPTPLFLAFALAGLALNIVPGADMTFVIASASRGGRSGGLTAALGIGGGALVHILAAVLGLSALLAASQTGFTIVKWVGAAYLLYIAISLLLAGNAAASDAQKGRQKTGWRLFRAAALINILNPKVALFMLAFLPQFVDPNAKSPALQILCLGLWFDFVGTLVNCIVAVVAADTAARLRHVKWLATAARWFAATILGALAFKLAFSERR